MQGKVTEKINCANPKDSHGLKLIRNNVLLAAILASLIRLKLKAHLHDIHSGHGTPKFWHADQ